MKLPILYIMLMVSCLMGTQQLAFGGHHAGKSPLSLIEKQQAQADHVLGIEDENDEDELTKKFTSNAKWLAAFSQSFLTCCITDTCRSFSRYSQSSCICDIYIVQRVLRI